MAARAARKSAPLDKREAILAAALELFSERGYDGTAMPMVAERAAVGAGTIYRHFESKEALGNAVFRQCKLAMQEYVLARRQPGLTAREELRGMWLGLWDFLRQQPAACRFLETQGHATYLDAASRAISEAVFVSITDFIRRGQAAGAIRVAAPAVLIAMALGAFIGLVKEADAGRFVLDDAVIEAAEPLIWDLVRA
jgi:TetR/AcrR family transcriptional regulator, repressor of fatR-cypB operon